jgi:RNA polymerase subunit RPABC4/transcription elongation factor Spt4
MYACKDCERIFITPEIEEEIEVCPYCNSECITSREEK